jgi:hypothetical protein
MIRMRRKLYIGTAAWLTLTATLGAQNAPPRFQWRAGQTMDYKVEQSTSVTDTMEDKTSETGSKLSTVRHWQIQDVDTQGIATVQLSLLSLRIETKSPNGDLLVFDSSQPDKSTPEMKKQMSQYVGVPLAVMRVNPLGRVLEVKQCNFGPASRYECEPPFGVVFANDMANGLWQRSYQVTLEPPQGTGEKFSATQKYSIKSQDNGKLIIGFSTDITLPAAIADQIPLLQWQPEGEIVFDLQNGATQSARFAIDKELKGHQGPGSTYRFQTTYHEEMVAPPPASAQPPGR